MSTTEHFNGGFDAAQFTDVESLIEAIVGVKAELVREFDLLTINPDMRLQIRGNRNNAPKEMVERYVHQMSRSVFPPIVVTGGEQPRIADGNTRFQARWQREERFTPVLVIPIDYDEADEDMKVRLEYLGFALNASNGKALEKSESREMIRHGIAMGQTNTQITGTVGVPITLVRQVRFEYEGELKLDRVELAKDLLHGPQLRALGTVVDLNDEPFKAIAQLAADSHFTVSEIKTLAQSCRELGADALAIERVAQERNANAQRIAEIERGGGGNPPASRGLRRSLGFVLARDPEVMVETNIEAMPEHMQYLQDAVKQLVLVIELQEKLMPQEVTS